MQIINHQPITVIPNANGQRPFPTQQLAHFDPFVMLDHIGPAKMPEDWKLDGGTDQFPNLHPHRGFETITMMFQGNMHHRDSVFTERPKLTSGSMQRMNAGKGIQHGGDMWADEHDRFHEIQLWVNSPAKYKMSEPSIHNVSDKDIPVIDLKNEHNHTGTLRLIAGELGEQKGPIETFANIRVIHGKTTQQTDALLTEQQLPTTHNRTLLYVMQGNIEVNGQRLQPYQSVAFEQIIDQLTIHTTEKAEFLLISGESLNEPIAFGGPFVMNTEDEIHQAFEDVRNGVF